MREFDIIEGWGGIEGARDIGSSVVEPIDAVLITRKVHKV